MGVAACPILQAPLSQGECGPSNGVWKLAAGVPEVVSDDGGAALGGGGGVEGISKPAWNWTLVVVAGENRPA